jgi:hypothetical protein
MSTTQQSSKRAKTVKKSVGSPATSKSVETLQNDLPYEIVSSFRLKRLKPKSTDQLIKLLIDCEDFKQLQLLGIKYGVTYCEVLKGLLNRELMDVNNGSTLSHYIPVLQA